MLIVPHSESYPPPDLQMIHFQNPEVERYNFHGIAGITISVPRDSAIARAIVDLQPLQTPQEENRRWALPMSAWIYRYHPESFAIYVASGKQPIRYVASRKQSMRDKALIFDKTRVREGLVINLHRHGFEHRKIPFTVELIPIYSPRSV